MAQLVLHPGKERSLFRRHPWIFAGSVDRLDGRARPGDTVTVVTAEGKALARAAWSPSSQIRARVWSFDAEAAIDHAFFKRAVAERAAQLGLGVRALSAYARPPVRCNGLVLGYGNLDEGVVEGTVARLRRAVAG